MILSVVTLRNNTKSKAKPRFGRKECRGLTPIATSVGTGSTRRLILATGAVGCGWAPLRIPFFTFARSRMYLPGMKLVMNAISTCSLVLALICSGALEAEDWALWRGPNRAGKSGESGLMPQWPAAGPPLAWKASGLGAGLATVTVFKGRVFTAGEKGKGSFVVALNESDGKQLWSAPLGKAGAPGWGGFAGPRCTPTVDGDRLYSLGQYGELVCLEVATGKELWRKSLVTDFGGSVPEWGYSESPLVDGERVLCTPGGSKGAVVALDRTSGALVWQSTEFTDEAQYSSLVPAVMGGVRLCVQITMKSVAGVALADGGLVWKAPRRGAVAVIPTPIVGSNFVYVTSGYKVGCNVFRVSGTGTNLEVSQAYAKKVIANHHGGVVLVRENVFGHSDGLGWVCQELSSGKEVWVEGAKVGKGSILYADGRLYLREENKQSSRIVLIEATPAGFKEHGRFEQPDHSGKEAWPHPVIANGRLYLRDQDILLCYDVKQK